MDPSDPVVDNRCNFILLRVLQRPTFAQPVASVNKLSYIFGFNVLVPIPYPEVYAVGLTWNPGYVGGRGKTGGA